MVLCVAAENPHGAPRPTPNLFLVDFKNHQGWRLRLPPGRAVGSVITPDLQLPLPGPWPADAPALPSGDALALAAQAPRAATS